MKKLVGALLTASMLLGLTACTMEGKKEEPAQAATDETPEETEAESVTETDGGSDVS